MITMTTTTTVADWKTSAPSWWCPGCGDFGDLAALQKALVAVGYAPEDVVIIAGVGCSGKIGNYVNSYNMHVTHGRTLPVAMGVKLANPRLKVIAAGGDGDGFAIGMSHFIHACRRNIDVTYIVMDNQIYGLTKGQTSPTSAFGFESKSTPQGNVEGVVDPLMLALTAGATFVAQGFAGNPKGLQAVFEAGLQHRGFAYINTFSPCPTYNKVNTFDFFRTELHDVDEDPGYLPNDRIRALQLLQKHRQFLHGVLYREERASFHELLPGFSEDKPPVNPDWQLSPAFWGELLNRYR